MQAVDFYVKKLYYKFTHIERCGSTYCLRKGTLMTISNAKKAERLIMRELAKGPIGDENRGFMDDFFYGKPAGTWEVRHVRTALDSLEKAGRIRVRRHAASGHIESVSLYETACEPEIRKVVEKPKLSNIELLIKIHEILKNKAVDGIILEKGKGVDGAIPEKVMCAAFIAKIYEEFSQHYRADKAEFTTVFGMMARLGLRGNAKMIRGQGMMVADVILSVGSSGDAVCSHESGQIDDELPRLRSEVARLQNLTGSLSQKLQNAGIENQRLQREFPGIIDQNAELTVQLERSEQSCNDLRVRNETLSAQQKIVSAFIEEYTMS